MEGTGKDTARLERNMGLVSGIALIVGTIIGEQRCIYCRHLVDLFIVCSIVCNVVVVVALVARLLCGLGEECYCGMYIIIIIVLLL